MAPAPAVFRGIEELPDEILLAILAYLDEKTLTTLQLVSKPFRVICRDDRLWKSRCFDESSLYGEFIFQLLSIQCQYDMRTAKSPSHQEKISQKLEDKQAISKTQLRANWDPSYPGEPVSWLEEYIQRYGPVTTNWFQSPYRSGATNGLLNEARGLALYTPGKAQSEPTAEPLFAVSPLDDGTVCLWDVNGTRTRRGAMLEKSSSGVLFSYGRDSANSRRENRINSVTEVVSVDSHSNRAFFAVQSRLIEVDLQRLDVVSQQSFEWSITTLSEATPGIPLTVGTSLGLHLYDHRAPRVHSPSYNERTDLLSRLFGNHTLPRYAPLPQPTPLCIHHLPTTGTQGSISNDIYVGGRWQSILCYDRRMWPGILGTFTETGHIASLASLPYPLVPDGSLRKAGKIPQEKILEAKSAKGQMLIAAGEYGSKGSLELVPLQSQLGEEPGEPFAVGGPRPRQPWGPVGSAVQNRQTVASAKIFSAIPHGTRIALSDGAGYIKWFERDGLTKVRQHAIGSPEAHDPSQTSMFHRSAETGEFARKLVSTRTRPPGHGEPTGGDDIVFWTGDRLGMVTFSGREGFQTGDFEAKEGRDAEMEEEAERYAGRMRRALEVQADGVRLTREMGLGGP